MYKQHKDELKEINNKLHHLFHNKKIKMIDVLIKFNIIELIDKIPSVLKNKVDKGRFIFYDGNEKHILFENEYDFYFIKWSGS